MHSYFKIAGPCFPGEHYMLPPKRRLGHVMELIEGGRWFTLRAGQQTGKTTSAMWLAAHYNAGSSLRVAWIDVQAARMPGDLATTMRTLLGAPP